MSTNLADREKTSLSVRIPKMLKSRAVSVAQARHVSFNAFVTSLIEQAVRETEQKPAPAVSEAEWRTLNDRRMTLIGRKRDHGLTAEEQTELARLQEVASLHVNQVLPLPLDELAELEKRRFRTRAVADIVGAPFDYPTVPHLRRHGPSGYTNYKAYKPWLCDEFAFRCAYCLVRERWFSSGSDAFSSDHVTPQTVDPARVTDYTNLVYVCLRCNSARQDHAVLNPCSVAFAEHIRVTESGAIEGLTPAGNAHIKLLPLDDPRLTEFRERMGRIVREWSSRADRHSLKELGAWLPFPDDLPDLAALRPPGGNSRPNAVRDCWYERRKRGLLPDYY